MHSLAMSSYVRARTPSQFLMPSFLTTQQSRLPCARREGAVSFFDIFAPDLFQKCSGELALGIAF